MSSLVTRPATPKDIPSIVKIRLATISEEEIKGFSDPELAITSSTKRLREAWESENRLKDGFEVFVAETDGKLSGFLFFQVNANCGYIDDIVVSRTDQRRGIGKSLVCYIEKIAKARGCLTIKTDTTQNAEGVPWDSYSFWIKMGYKDTGERVPTRYSFKEIPFVKRIG